jgi:hypothetical protein
MRFKIPLSEFNQLSSAVPALKNLDYKLSQDQQSVLLRGGELSKVKQSEFALNRACQSFFGNNFENWSNGYKQEPFKLYKFMIDDRIWKDGYGQEKYEPPFNVDFKTELGQQLHKKMLPKEQGKPTRVEYYEIKRPEADGVGGIKLDPFGRPIFEYINLVASIDYTLTYDSLGFILEKVATLRWYRTDDSVSEESKNIGRLFDPILDFELRIEEGKLRRESIVNSLQLPVLDKLREIFPDLDTLGLLTVGRVFLDKFDEEFRDFIDKSKSITDTNSVDFGKKEIWVKIRDHGDSEDSWLDQDLGDGDTIRQFILDELDI